jgi:hypothetical protein
MWDNSSRALEKDDKWWNGREVTERNRKEEGK